MRKKCPKLLLFSFILLFISSTPVFAKEMTLDELGKEIEKYNKDAESAYIIGNYVFTSGHRLTTQDIMLASRSITADKEDGEKGPDDSTNVGADKIYGKMSIHLLKRKYDAKLSPTGWEFSNDNKVVGETQLKLDDKNKIDIRYIDYNFIAKDTPSKVALVDDKDTKYKEVIQKYFSKLGKQQLVFSSDSTETDKYLEGLLLKTTTLNDNVFNEDEKTGYYFALSIKVPGATEEAGSTIKVKGAKTEKEFNYSQFDVKEKDNEGISLLYSVDPKTQDEDKKITITVDFDGNGKNYASKTYTIDYSRLKFQENSGMSMSLESLNTKVQDNKTYADLIQESFAFAGNKEMSGFDKLTLTKDSGNTYKLKGSVFQEKTKYNGLDKADVVGYFFSFVLTAMNKDQEFSEAKNSGVTVTDGKTIVDASAFDTNSSIGLLRKLDENCARNSDKSHCKYTLTIDNDGDGNQYLPVEYTIDYSEVTFVKNSITTLKDDSSNDTVKAQLKKDYGWEPKTGYKVDFKEDSTQTNLVKVTGLIPIVDKFENGKTPFTGEAATGYYLAFTIHTDTAKKSATTVQFVHPEEHSDEDKIAKGADFDNDNDIYVLKHLHPTDMHKTFDIVIDIDGEGQEYTPYTLTIDWSGLNFQQASKATKASIGTGSPIPINNGYVSSKDRNQIEGWGYDFGKLGQPTLTENAENADYKLGGSVKQQEVPKAGFEDDNGYYVVLKVFGPTEETVGKGNDKKWTVQLKNEKGAWKNVETPSSEDYTNGFIAVLIKLKENEEKKITYKIDFDGNENNYLPYEEVIDYSTLELIPYYDVTFKYFNEEGVLKTVVDKQYKGELIKTDKVVNLADSFDYHTFDQYWIDESTGNKFDLGTTALSKETILKAHYTIDDKKFVNDIFDYLNKSDNSPNYQDKLEFALQNHDITIKVKDPSIKISELNEQILSGTIAYILNKGEIGNITLSMDSATKKFNKDGIATASLDPEVEKLKGKIKTGVEEVFNTALSKDETLNNIAVNGKKFTLALEDLDKSTKLSDDLDSATYTFILKTESAIVMNEEQLTTALNNNEVKSIIIGNSFTIKNQHDVKRNGITIQSSSEESKTLTGEDSVGTIFNIQGQNVNIQNLKLTGSKSAITVENGGSLTANNIDFSNVTEKGVIVKGSASFTGTKLKYDNEKYLKPLVQADNNAKVDLTRSDASKAPATTVQKVTPYSGPFASASISVSDTLAPDPDYNNVKHYFLNSKVENRWLEVTFTADRTITGFPFSYQMYYDKESGVDYLPEPQNAGVLTQYKDKIATFNVTGWVSSTGKEYQKGKIDIPSQNTSYTTKYTVSYDNNKVAEVTNEDQLKKAIASSSSDDKKYIVVKNEITLTDILTIDHPVSIIGSESGSKEITGSIKGEIVIAADGVLFDEIKIIGKKIPGKDSSKHVITVQQKNFRSDESIYSVEGSATDFDSIIYYSTEDPTTTLYYNKFNASVNTYIDFAQTVDGVTAGDSQLKGTSVIGNMFYDENDVKTFININKIKKGTTVKINQNDAYLTSGKDATFIKVKALSPAESATLQVSSVFLANKNNGVNTTKIIIDNKEVDDASGLTINTYKSTFEKLKISYSGTDLTETEKAVKVVYNDKN